MLREITSEQFGEWMAFSELEPFGSETDTSRAALVAATVANSSIKFSKTDWAVSDFMPKERPAEPVKSSARRVLDNFIRAGAKEKRHG